MLEEEIFRKSEFIIDKCLKYGFRKEKDTYIYHKSIKNNTFEGKIIDKETNEEYTSFRIEKQIGEFGSSIRNEFIILLENIKDKCTNQDDFMYPQANRINKWIHTKYGDNPEYLWEDDKNAVFRNKDNKKWYGIIMTINQNKLDKQNRMIEVMNVKLPPEEIDELVKKEGYYRAYHMNKKHWITFRLDDTIDDTELHKRIEKSYQYTVKE